MADNEISTALAGQQGTPAAVPVQQQQPAQQQAQPQVNYVTNEQLSATVEEIKRMVQSSTDKSYSRVQKMIDNLKQAGIQNPTYEQAQAMLNMQEQSDGQNAAQNAQNAQPSTADPAAAAWIQEAGGDPTKDYWNDIYDAAQESGVGTIAREDPEYAQFFMENGQVKQFQKPRQFVRAFEQAFEAKKQRLNAQPGRNLASSPALGGGGQKSTYIDPRSTSANNLITSGLRGY